MKFKYEVALSFAGEQRAEVEEVAARLRQAGVDVFYDDYEKATLWGKNLYTYLSEVYRNRAKYCIIFASKDYAERVWTNHELQSAQARALQENGNEYILPVRFDSTEIPGLLPTVGYLNFNDEGISGICSAFLAKIGKTNLGQVTEKRALTCDLSTRVLVNAGDDGFAVPEAAACSWGGEISMTAQGSDYDAVFSHLRQKQPKVVIAYAFDVATAKLTAATRRVAGGQVQWDLTFSPIRTEFTDAFEVGTTNTSADQFAEMKVRRLLLGEYPYAEDARKPLVDQLNDASREALLQGLNTLVKVEKCRFPELFQALKSDPQLFLSVAWIDAASSLKLSGAVEVIQKLRLTLVHTTLEVEFLGRRHRKYVNTDPCEIRVEGKVELA